MQARVHAGLSFLTDDALFEETGIRIAFTSRQGGVSTGCYESLNLGSHVEDDPEAVEENRRILAHALGAAGVPLVVPNQVHGTQVVSVLSCDSAPEAQRLASQGADALLVGARSVAGLMCFADCVPVVAACNQGFALMHAGWRGAVAGVVGKTLGLMAQQIGADLSQTNVYIGPHIHASCFETGEEVARQFKDAFGSSCLLDSRHVSLSEAVRIQAREAGVSNSRIVDAGICTKCHPDEYFSYRASGGRCGRHGAAAVRMAR